MNDEIHQLKINIEQQIAWNVEHTKARIKLTKEAEELQRGYVKALKALDKASQILQDHGLEEESKAIDCMFNL